MAHGVKYRIAYPRLSGGRTTIDILKRDYSGAITTYKGGKPPLKISFEGNFDNLYGKPTIGTGVEIKISVPSLSMLDLFTDDPQEYIIKIYNGDSGGTLVWQGFLNAEMYSEDYSNPLDKPITIYGNDGMSVLENIRYIENESADNYSGIQRIGEILENILNRLELSFTYIYTSNDICINEVGQTNPFLYLEMAAENFYDEKGVPMTCREVLNSIFGAHGLVVRFKGSNIYIIDPINLHDTGKGKRYDVAGTLGGNETVVDTVGGYLDISGGDISWGETGSFLDITPAISNAKVVYDPYNYTGHFYDFNSKEYWSLNPGSFTYYASTPDYWINSGWTSGLRFSYWSCENASGGSIDGFSWEGYKDSLYGNPIYYIKLSDTDVVQIFNPPNSFVAQDQNLELKVGFEVYVNTKHLNNLSSDNPSALINQVSIPVLIKVGDQINQDGGNSWEGESTGSETYLEVTVLQDGVSVATPEESVINDVWTPASIVVPLGQTTEEIFLSGAVEIRILDSIKTYFADQILPTENAAAVHNILIRNVSIAVVYKDSGIQIDNDSVETEAQLSTNLTGKQELQLKCTTGVGVYGCSRGALKTQQQPIQGQNVPALYRDPVDSTMEFTSAKLLLQSIISQYKLPRFKLTGTLDVSSDLLDVWFKLIKDSNHLSDRAFYIYNGEYDDEYEMMRCDLIEVTDTREDIE